MAIAAAYQTVASVTTTAGTIWTTAAGYTRDLVITNGGTATVFVGMGTTNVATSVASFAVPSGATLVLCDGAIPTSTPVTAIYGASGATGNVSVGYASVVSVI